MKRRTSASWQDRERKPPLSLMQRFSGDPRNPNNADPAVANFLLEILTTLILEIKYENYYNCVMRTTLRKTRTFSLDPDVLTEVERTRGNASASERVNHLLKTALEMERKSALAEEAAEFYNSAPEDRQERRAFQRAGLKSWSRK